MKPTGIGKLSGHVKRDGIAKRAYATRDEALAAQPNQLPYLCELCHRWHCANRPRQAQP